MFSRSTFVLKSTCSIIFGKKTKNAFYLNRRKRSPSDQLWLKSDFKVSCNMEEKDARDYFRLFNVG